MKKLQFLLFLMLFATSAIAQEYATREIKLRGANEVRAGLPIDVTKESSEVSIKYGWWISSPWYYAGDYLTKLVFRGYNPGKEVKKHLTVQVSTDNMGKHFTTVFDGNCTIPSGGTEDTCIPMLTIDFSAPLLAENISPLNVRITCTGEAAETPVYFEQYVEGTSCWPAALLTIQSDVAYFDRIVTHQNGDPISGATVTVYNAFLSYSAQTEDNGKCSVKVDDANVEYQLAVTAPGYPDYVSGFFYLKSVPEPSPLAGSIPDDIVLTDKLDFTAGQQATIVLPKAPNPSWGRYYRLDRHEGRDIIFEREYEPKANTPYVIIPTEDFSINLVDYELSQLDDPEVIYFPDNKETWHTGFHSSYKSQPMRSDLYDGEFVYLIDQTPDCKNGAVKERRIGACRAYLVLGAYSPEMRFEGPRYVFVGEETSISEKAFATTNSTTSYDLQGRRLQGKPEKGVYIQDGKKYLVK